MDNSRILIVGAGGQLGQALHEKYPTAQAMGGEELDITNWQSVSEYDWDGVDTIINAAAYTKVDDAESPAGREQAWKINAVGPANLARIAIAHSLTLVHVSSDYVFDGTRSPHTEDEPFTPLSVYGQSKAAGDIAVSTVPKHYTLRTTWLIGSGHNFVKTMVGLAARNINPTVVDDQIGRLTFTSDLVGAIDHLLTNKSEYGTYNLSGDGPTASWAQIARLAFSAIGRDDIKVTDSSTEDYNAGKQLAPRPLKSALDLTKIKAAGFNPGDWRANLRAYARSL